MQKVFLHIGRHKTGTSSIQNFFASNQDLIGDYNYLYPKTGFTGVAHHELAYCLSKKITDLSSGSSIVDEIDLCQQLLSEINETQKNIIISSEAIQNTNPELFGDLLKNKDVHILIYLRNQQDYLASAYAQKVWATRYTESIEDYYNNIFDADYYAFLDKWEKVFPGKVHVRRFGRDQLHSNDIVVDFVVNMLNIQNVALINKIKNRQTFDCNPSLTVKLLQFKTLFNKLNLSCSQQEERLLRLALSKLCRAIDDQPVKLTNALASAVAKKSLATNESVSKKYFDGEILFEMRKGVPPAPALSNCDYSYIVDELLLLDPNLNNLFGKLNNLRTEQRLQA